MFFQNLKWSGLLMLASIFFQKKMVAQLPNFVHFQAEKLPHRWDEALPMGNALLGALLWQPTHNIIRLSLDRADLWDNRPMENMDDPRYNYHWIMEQLQQANYLQVQEKLDAPYEKQAAPSKLPGARLEFDIGNRVVKYCQLNIETGLASVQFSDGSELETFVHANHQAGWFRWKLPAGKDVFSKKSIKLVPPAYQNADTSNLSKLGYPLGFLESFPDGQVYRQPCWGGFSYQVAVFFRRKGQHLEGVWSISSHFPQAMWAEHAEKTSRRALKRGFDQSFSEHKKWWENFWKRSSVHLPDTILLRQYFREEYKFGCLARKNAPAISLQGVWTADNGQLPPWKGDFHHDLNTEMSYWHALTAGRADLSEGYLRFLLSNDESHRRWTKQFFGTDGLNVPGVETLLGNPMGGWVQYACSPTTSAWLAHHFYEYWNFTRDENFLKNHAYPFLKNVGTHLLQLTKFQENQWGDRWRVLPLSSSPEINDNDASAWFSDTWTTHDLALARFVFEKLSELSVLLKQEKEHDFWTQRLAELPKFSLTEQSELNVAPTLPYQSSHRHLAHLMPIFPLGQLVWHNDEHKTIIQNSLSQLQKIGTNQWTGYTFAWQACLFARARNADEALRSLQIFAEAFVSNNSFHLNGDQSGKGYSNFTYRPFTLEGNFAFAAGVQQMLLQSVGGRVVVFPAVPNHWQDVKFENLQAAGGIKLSAEKVGGKSKLVRVTAEKAEKWILELPEGNWHIQKRKGNLKIVEKISDHLFQLSGRGEVVFGLEN